MAGYQEGRPHPRPANGVLRAGGKRQLVIKLDQETFDQVREMAAREKVSVSHQLRLLIEWGLEAAKCL